MAEEQQERPRRFLGAISGSTSSRKTSLSFGLFLVFREISTINFLNQDNYFAPMAQCPKIIWAKSDQHKLSRGQKKLGANDASQGEIISFQGPGGMKVGKVYSKKGFHIPATDLGSPQDKLMIWPFGANSHVDPKKIMPNDKLLHEYNLTFPFFNRSPVEYQEAFNSDGLEAIDWNSLARDISDFRFPPKLVRGLPPSARRYGDYSILVERQVLARGLLENKTIELLQMEVVKALKKVSDDNKSVNFEGKYVKNGTMDLGIIEGSLLFLENRPHWTWESFMKACGVKIFLQSKRDLVKRRQFTRIEYVNPPLGTRFAHQQWKFEEYFDHVVWPQYVSLHRWMFSDGDVEKNVDHMEREDYLSHKALQYNLYCYSYNQPLNMILYLAVHQIINGVTCKEKEWREQFVQSQTG